jgi:hypothetical protein
MRPREQRGTGVFTVSQRNTWLGYAWMGAEDVGASKEFRDQMVDCGLLATLGSWARSRRMCTNHRGRILTTGAAIEAAFAIALKKTVFPGAAKLEGQRPANGKADPGGGVVPPQKQQYRKFGPNSARLSPIGVQI